MTDNEAGVLITPKQIQAWEDQIATLQRKVAAGKEILYGRVVSAAGTVKGEAFMSGAAVLRVSFMGAIVALANGDKPISRAEMREKLSEMGFSKEKIAQQFNTVLYKTKEAERTSFRDDGKVWKGKKN